MAASSIPAASTILVNTINHLAKLSKGSYGYSGL
jgi:hypothetical protein